MSLLKYFKQAEKKPSEELQKSEFLSLVTETEKQQVVHELKEAEGKGSKRGKYRRWTGEEKAEIGSFATVHGVAETLRKLKGKYPHLTKQSISDFKKAAQSAQKRTGQLPSTISSRKRGRPALMPEDLMKKTITLVEALRLKGAPVTASVINSIAKGVVIANDRSILIEYGGYLSLNSDWGKNVLYRMEKEGQKMTRICATTSKLPVAPGIISEVKLDFQRKIKAAQSKHDIPDDLIINFDQTPLSYICSPNHTLHQRGAKSVPLISKGKKKQITGTFTVTKSGIFLPMQLIYQGKTARCLPREIEFPDGFNVCYTENHWSNEEKVIELLQEVIFPFIASKKVEHGLAADQKALLIFDVFRAHKTEMVLHLMEQNSCEVVFVPANMTHHFQPLDLTINGVAKKFLTTKFEEWYAKEITQQINAGVDVYSIEIKTTLSVLKAVHARWLIGLYDHLRNQSDLIQKGFDVSGITAAIASNIEPEDPFLDLDSDE